MSIFSKDALSHKHVLITGSTGDIGDATAKLLVQMGAKVTITGRNTDKLGELQKKLSEYAPAENIFVQAADLTDREDRNRLIARAEEAHGFINGLVNSAGVAGGKTVEELDEEFIERLMNLNFKSTFLLTQAVYIKMLERKEGDIVNLASLAGLRGTHGNTAYSASKFAVVGWTQSMALEAIEHGIRVNSVSPGYVDGDMALSSIRKKAERKGIPFEQGLKEAEQNIPSGRLSTPEEVAHTIAFLLTDAAKNIVGTSVKISGGNYL